MAAWRFYQGLRSEWRWYRFDAAGAVIGQSDQGFAELPACMANAEAAGFTGAAYQVHTRRADDTIADAGKKSRASNGWKGSPPNGNATKEGASA